MDQPRKPDLKAAKERSQGIREVPDLFLGKDPQVQYVIGICLGVHQRSTALPSQKGLTDQVTLEVGRWVQTNTHADVHHFGVGAAEGNLRSRAVLMTQPSVIQPPPTGNAQGASEKLRSAEGSAREGTRGRRGRRAQPSQRRMHSCPRQSPSLWVLVKGDS